MISSASRDAEARRSALASLWTEDARYVDPLASVAGPDAISELIGAVQAQAPGFEFRLANGVDAHHDVVRFGWELVPASGGEPLAIGFDVAAMHSYPSAREPTFNLDTFIGQMATLRGNQRLRRGAAVSRSDQRIAAEGDNRGQATAVASVPVIRPCSARRSASEGSPSSWSL